MTAFPISLPILPLRKNGVSKQKTTLGGLTKRDVTWEQVRHIKKLNRLGYTGEV